MSLLDLLLNDDEWNNYLEHKRSSSHLPDKIVKDYENFILECKYKDIACEVANGTYEFSIPKKVLISKMGKSKKRVVYIYNNEETYALKMITYLLYKYDYLFSPNLYSFRQETGVKKAIMYIANNNFTKNMYAYKLDIKNYFNSIPVHSLLEKLEDDLQDEKLYALISNILLKKKVNYAGEIIEEEKGIMAGIPISSFLANYYLKDLDSYFYNAKIPYLRYADDIIFFSKDKEGIEKNSLVIKDFLAEKGLEVNEEKEFFYNIGDKIDFLGFSFCSGSIDVSDNSFKKIKGKIRRTARGLRRWMIKKDATPEVTLKAMNRKYNRKFFGKNENDLTWKYWFFPVINTVDTLKKVDSYLQDEERYVVTGVHNKRNFEKVPYDYLKKCNYKSLVNEYYKSKK